MKQTRQKLLFFLFCVLLFLPRILSIDAYTLGDELRWVMRSDLAFKALQEGKLSETGSLGYPGVTTMATLGPVVNVYRVFHHLGSKEVESWSTIDQHHVLVWSRTATSIITGFLGIWLFFLVRRLRYFKDHDAVSAVITLAIVHEPWLLGLSRTVMLDAYLSLFVLLALVAACVARETGERRFLLQSGLALGFAFLTKSLALFFGPIIGIALLHAPWRTLPRRLGVWVGSIIGTIFLFWPAMWVHPIARISELLFWNRHPIEVREELYWPGIHPPFVLLALSLPAFVGLCAYVLFRLSDLFRPSKYVALFPIDLAFLAGLAFQVAMQLVESDNSRWILPSIVLLSVPGAMGLYRLLRFVRLLPTHAAGVMFVLYGGMLFVWFPFFTLYTNPLFRTEASSWQIGMGEGFRELAQYLETQEGDVQVVSISPGLLDAYLDDKRIHIGRFPRSGKMEDLTPETTHVVVSASRIRTLFDAGAMRTYLWMDKHTPDNIVTVRGVPLLVVYKLR